MGQTMSRKNPNKTQPTDAQSDAHSAAALRLQCAMRGYLARKRYKITPPTGTLPSEVYCTGNDPAVLIPEHLKSKEQFAVVGTSCLRVLDIAAMFCASDTNFIPKIFVVDINPHVREFWLVIKTIFNCSTSIEELQQHIFTNQANLHGLLDTVAPFSDRASQMLKLLGNVAVNFGFERLKKMVANLVSLTHDWTDPNAFQKIKNICELTGFSTVYTYSSNILACIDPYLFDADPHVAQLLKNVAILNPRASIFSDYDPVRSMPGKMLCYTGTGERSQLAQDIGTRFTKKRCIAEQSVVFSKKFREKLFSEALPYAIVAYNNFSRLPNIITKLEKMELSDLAHNVGATYHELGQLDKGFHYLRIALSLRESTDHPKIQTTRDRMQKIMAYKKSQGCDFSASNSGAHMSSTM